MSTPTKAQSNAAAAASMDAIVTAANVQWQDSATQAIAQAVAQGKFSVGLYMTPRVSIHDIIQYFRALGYQIFVPPADHEFSAYYFGYGWFGLAPDIYYDGFDWVGWCKEKNFCTCKNACHVIISWR